MVHNQRKRFNLIQIGTLQQNYLNISELNILPLKSRKLGNKFSKHKTEFVHVTQQDERKLKKEISWIQYGKEREDRALLINTWLCIEVKENKRELVVYSQSRSSSLKRVGIHHLPSYFAVYDTLVVFLYCFMLGSWTISSKS